MFRSVATEAWARVYRWTFGWLGAGGNIVGAPGLITSPSNFGEFALGGLLGLLAGAGVHAVYEWWQRRNRPEGMPPGNFWSGSRANESGWPTRFTTNWATNCSRSAPEWRSSEITRA